MESSLRPIAHWLKIQNNISVKKLNKGENAYM